MTPELPEEHYSGVGRVAVAAAKLEAMLAQVLVSAGLADQDEDWFGATTRRPLERLRKARQEFPDGHPVRALCHDAKRALEHRNRIVHSLAYLDGAPEDGGPARWVLVHPRSGDDVAMPSAEEFHDLWSRLNALSARCLVLALELATERLADSPRTDDPA